MYEVIAFVAKAAFLDGNVCNELRIDWEAGLVSDVSNQIGHHSADEFVSQFTVLKPVLIGQFIQSGVVHVMREKVRDFVGCAHTI
jgi:hypothetical protein